MSERLTVVAVTTARRFVERCPNWQVEHNRSGTGRLQYAVAPGVRRRPGFLTAVPKRCGAVLRFAPGLVPVVLPISYPYQEDGLFTLSNGIDPRSTPEPVVPVSRVS
jgi:hypothetical protein